MSPRGIFPKATKHPVHFSFNISRQRTAAVRTSNIQLTADVCQDIFYRTDFISYQMSAFPRRLRSLSIKRLFEPVVNKSDVLDRKSINYRRVDGFPPLTTGSSHNSRDRETLTLRRDEASVTIVMHAKKVSESMPTSPQNLSVWPFVVPNTATARWSFEFYFFGYIKPREVKKKNCANDQHVDGAFFEKIYKNSFEENVCLETSLGAPIAKLIRTGSVEVDKRRDGLKWSAVSIHNRTLELERNTKLVYQQFRWSSEAVPIHDDTYCISGFHSSSRDTDELANPS